MFRTNYNNELKKLRDELLNLGNLVSKVLEDSINALITRDKEKSQFIYHNDDVIDKQFHLLEHMCWSIILKQQPVAGDLRFVTNALKMITDLERIGDQAADIAGIASQMCEKEYPAEIKLIEKMAKETTVMILEAVEALRTNDSAKATAVIARDDFVDDVFNDVKVSVAHTISSETTGAMQEVNMVLVAKYFERIGDHTVNVAEAVVAMGSMK